MGIHSTAVYRGIKSKERKIESRSKKGEQKTTLGYKESRRHRKRESSLGLALGPDKKRLIYYGPFSSFSLIRNVNLFSKRNLSIAYLFGSYLVVLDICIADNDRKTACKSLELALLQSVCCYEERTHHHQATACWETKNKWVLISS